MNLKLKKLIPVSAFIVASFSSFNLLDLYYFSTQSPDFWTYFSYIEFLSSKCISVRATFNILIIKLKNLFKLVMHQYQYIYMYNSYHYYKHLSIAIKIDTDIKTTKPTINMLISFHINELLLWLSIIISVSYIYLRFFNVFLLLNNLSASFFPCINETNSLVRLE